MRARARGGAPQDEEKVAAAQEGGAELEPELVAILLEVILPQLALEDGPACGPQLGGGGRGGADFEQGDDAVTLNEANLIALYGDVMRASGPVYLTDAFFNLPSVDQLGDFVPSKPLIDNNNNDLTVSTVSHQSLSHWGMHPCPC